MVQEFRNAGLRAEAPEIAGNEVRVAFTTGDVVRSSQDIANALSAVVKIMLLTSLAALAGLAIIGFILASGPSAFVKAGKGIAMAAEGASTAMQEIGRILNGNLFMNDSTNGDGNKTGRIPITLMILGGVALVLVLRR